MDERGDAELPAGVAPGDDAAFAVLYERYLPLVLRWCSRETANREPRKATRGLAGRVAS
jgi:hypothetical protein